MAVPDYPHKIIHVRDVDPNPGLVSEEFRPYDLPLAFVWAERSEKGILPVYAESTIDATKAFGAKTFNMQSKFYSPSTHMLTKSLRHHGCYIVGFQSDDATTASLVLECTVEPDVDIQQYKFDVYGNIMTDSATGDKLFDTDDDGNIKTLKGCKLTYKTRKLQADETFDSIKPKTAALGDKQITTFPILATIDRSPGASGNDYGFAVYHDAQDNDAAKVGKLGNVVYTFAPIQRANKGSGTIPFLSYNNMTSVEFVAEPDAQDEIKLWNFNDVVPYAYRDLAQLPFEAHLYSDSFKEIATKILSYDTTLANAVGNNPWEVNIFSLTDINGRMYKQAMMDTTGDAICLNDDDELMQTGGEDDDLTDEQFQSKVDDYLRFKSYPQIQDNARYPISALYDPGYSLTTKDAMLEFMYRRGDVFLVLSTQNYNDPVNPPDVDAGMRNHLVFKALNLKEDVLNGTDCSRVMVMCQAGLDKTQVKWKRPLPTVAWIADAFGSAYGSQTIKQEPTRYPFNLQTMIDLTMGGKVDNIPYGHLIQDHWAGSGNVCVHYDEKKLFYAALRTVYPNSSSGLANPFFVARLTYAKHRFHKIWAQNSGRDDDQQTVMFDVKRQTEEALTELIGNKFPFTVYCEPTEDDSLQGFVFHCYVVLEPNPQTRVIVFDITCKRRVTATQ